MLVLVFFLHSVQATPALTLVPFTSSNNLYVWNISCLLEF